VRRISEQNVELVRRLYAELASERSTQGFEQRMSDTDIEILRGVRMLGALPAATIEQLGARLEHAEFVSRQTVFEQGERGEGFYIVESARAEVVRDGRVVATLGRGSCFGEIALCATSRERPPFAHPRMQTCA
jgi:CRP-like cAMP-binding protein